MQFQALILGGYRKGHIANVKDESKVAIVDSIAPFANMCQFIPTTAHL